MGRLLNKPPANAVHLDLGGKAVRLWIPAAADCVIIEFEGHRFECRPQEVISLGQALIFVVSCLSSEYATQVLDYDPSESVNHRRRMM